MFRDRKVIVVMPAYNAARTLKRTYDEVMAEEIVDLVIVVDDGSKDDTVAVARTLPQTRAPHPSDQPRLRRQSEDLLSPGVGGRRRHRHHDPSRLPIHPASDPRDGRHGGHGPVSLRAGFEDSWRLRLAGRDALVEIPLQSSAHLGREPRDRREALGVPHRLSGLFAGTAGIAHRWRRAPTISSSTIRCSPKSCGWERRLPRSVVPPATSPIPPRSTSRGAWSTGWDACGRRSVFVWPRCG